MIRRLAASALLAQSIMGCGDSIDLGDSSGLEAPQTADDFTSGAAVPTNTLGWVDNFSVVAGVAPLRLGLRFMPFGAKALGVDALGGVTTMSFTQFDGESSRIFLERLDFEGVSAWSRSGVCNTQVLDPLLAVDARGRSLLGLSFAGSCSWEDQQLQSTLDPSPVAQSFVHSGSASTAAGLTEDVLLFAYDDQGSRRGFAQLGGTGRQRLRSLSAGPSGPSALVQFEAKLALGERTLIASAGGLAADQVLTRIDNSAASTAGDEAMPLEFLDAQQFEGARLESVTTRQAGLLLAGVGPVPRPLVAADVVAATSEQSWVVAVSAEGALQWGARWLPAAVPVKVAADAEGNVYLAFPAVGIALQAVTSEQLQAATELTEPLPSAGITVVKLSDAGELLWQRSFASGFVTDLSLAVNRDRVSIWATHDGTIEIDGIIASTPSALQDALVLTLDGAGVVRYAVQWGTPQDSDAALSPVAHPAGGFAGILRLGVEDVEAGLSPGEYVLRVPDPLPAD